MTSEARISMIGRNICKYGLWMMHDRPTRLGTEWGSMRAVGIRVSKRNLKPFELSLPMVAYLTLESVDKAILAPCSCSSSGFQFLSSWSTRDLTQKPANSAGFCFLHGELEIPYKTRSRLPRSLAIPNRRRPPPATYVPQNVCCTRSSGRAGAEYFSKPGRSP